MEGPAQPAHDAASEVPGPTSPDAFSRLLAELARAPAVGISAAPHAGLQPRQTVGRFELLREIGRGGFGVVYEARDLHLNRSVAFKALRPTRALQADHVAGLRREAEAAARLNHPNIVTLHDFGTCDAGPYLILELLHGETLGARLARGRMGAREAVYVATEVARALVHAHAAGVLHRDLKPDNVFLARDGAVKVLDFGLARLLGSAGAHGGTPAFMAPEQWRGEPDDERTDLFSLGCVLHYMLTGALPYAVERGRSAALDPGPAPAPDLPGAPRALPRLVQHLLAKDPRSRPASPAAVLEELIAIGRRLDAPAIARRRRRFLLAVATAAGLGALLGTYVVRTRVAAPRERLTVVVADVVNETGEKDLDGLSGLIITSLEQSHRLAVLTRSRVFDLTRKWKIGEADRIDEHTAREVGRRAGAKALLASIRRFENLYSLELKALDPAADSYLFTLEKHGNGKASIPGLIDLVSEATRRDLNEREADVRASEVRVAQAVTASLEAYQHYFAGVDCVDRPSRGESWTSVGSCAELFRKALAIDPTFALAHYQLAWIEASEHTGDAATSISEAMRFIDRAPAKERLVIRAWKAHLDGHDDDALALYGKVLGAFPEDKQALFLVGDLRHHRGEIAHAVPYFERALALDPTFEWVLDHVTDDLGALGRQDELRQHVERWSRLPPSPRTDHALVKAHAWLGELDAAASTARRALAQGGEAATLDLAKVLVLRGEMGAAETELRAARGAGARAEIWLANVVRAQGRRVEALSILDSLRSVEPEAGFHFGRALLLLGDPDLEPALAEARDVAMADRDFGGSLSIWLAFRGELERADALASALPPGSSRRGLYDAMRSWRTGERAAAKQALRALDATDPLPYDAPAPSYLLAEVCADDGDDACTVEAVQRFQGLWPNGLWRSWALPRSMFLAAAAHARLGDAPRAQAELERLLVLSARADRDLTLPREARALRERVR